MDETTTVTQFADEAETLKHMELMYSVYGATHLLIWRTAEGKWIDSTVLDRLAAQGLIERTCSPVRSMFVSPQYYFIP